jgi:hypothetical protein
MRSTGDGTGTGDCPPPTALIGVPEPAVGSNPTPRQLTARPETVSGSGPLRWKVGTARPGGARQGVAWLGRHGMARNPIQAPGHRCVVR